MAVKHQVMFFNKSFLIIGILSIILAACQKSPIAVEKQHNKFFEVIDGDISFASEVGGYEPGFIRTDGFQRFGAFKNGLYTSTKSGEMGGYTRANHDYPEIRLDAFFINEHSLRSFLALEHEERSAIVEENAGKEVTYKFVENGKEVYSEPLYLPKDITVNLRLSNILRFEGSGIGLYKKGLPLYINRDPQNSNGILVNLFYRGLSLNTTLDDIQNSDADNGEIRRCLYVPVDSGKIEFPEGFFDGIPNDGIFSLQINRTSYKMFNIGEETHKLSADIGYSISLAMVRE